MPGNVKVLGRVVVLQGFRLLFGILLVAEQKESVLFSLAEAALCRGLRIHHVVQRQTCFAGRFS